MRSSIPYWLALMLVVGAIYAGFKWWQVQQSRQQRQLALIAAADAPQLTSFELVERSGEPFRSDDYLGRVWVGSFFFTTCPGTCAKLNRNIQQLQEDPELADVIWVSITVDPATDDLEALRKYADAFSAEPDRWLFCRGELDYVKRIGADIFRQSVTFQGHSDYGILIDREGRMRGAFNINDPAQKKVLKQELLKVLAENATETTPAAEENPPAASEVRESAEDAGDPPAGGGSSSARLAIAPRIRAES